MVSLKQLVQACTVVLTLAGLCAQDADASHPTSRRASATHRHSSSATHYRKSRSKRHRKTRRQAASVAAKQVPPEYGVLVVSENGGVIFERMPDAEFNPASVAKVVTAYGAMKTFGLNHRFSTSAWINGRLDANGVVHGDLYVQGIDPDFEPKDALALRQDLVSAGIRQVKGKLFVNQGFSYGSIGNSASAAQGLARSWSRAPGARIKVLKGVGVGDIPQTVSMISEFHSEIFRETLKEMLSYSQNGVAEQIGRAAGGLRRLEAIVSQQAGLTPGALKLSSASGLGKGRVTPRDMMLVLRAFRYELQREGLDLQDVFPLAGIDKGTLDERFTTAEERGSVVAKTGSLPGTDGGTSTLAGMFSSQQENFYFVIFCWKGNVPTFRKQQDQLIRQLQALRGGPKPFVNKLAHYDGV